MKFISNSYAGVEIKLYEEPIGTAIYDHAVKIANKNRVKGTAKVDIAYSIYLKPNGIVYGVDYLNLDGVMCITTSWIDEAEKIIVFR